MIFPLIQLVVLGYAFGGNVKHLKLGVVDQDHGLPAVKVRELAQAVSAGARTFDTDRVRRSRGEALSDLRNGRINGVLTIPPDFSRRVAGEERAARRADRGQHRQLRRGDAGRRRRRAGRSRSNQPAAAPRVAGRSRRSTSSRSTRTCRTSSTCCRDRS